MTTSARRWRRIAPAIGFVAFLLSGCIEVQSATPDEIRIDTGWAGEIAPGTKSWWGYLRAREHCAASHREEQLVDIQGTVAVYRCVTEKS